MEILFPNFIDQQPAYRNQFTGMTEEPFTYQDFEDIRQELVEYIHQNLTDSDKQFILNFEKATPNWDKYNFSVFPAVQWKLQNIRKLRLENPDKHQDAISNLQEKLEI